MKRMTLIVGLLLVLLLPGCSHLSAPSEDLFHRVRNFNEHMRWKRLRSASNYLPASQRQRWLQGMLAAAETMRIVDYTMVPIRVGAQDAVVDVTMSSYRANNPVIDRQRRRQWWEVKEGAWFLVRDKRLPVKGTAAPRGIPDIQGEPPPRRPRGAQPDF